MIAQKGASSWPRKKGPKAARAAKAAGAPAAPEPFGTDRSRQLCEEIAYESGGACLLGFSRGKDSIAAWLYLREFFPKIFPFHLASVPHLSFVDRSLAYYEKVFGTAILRYMDGKVTGALADLVYQTPDREAELDAMGLWEYTVVDVAALLRRHLGLTKAWCAVSIGMSDGIVRRAQMKERKGLSPSGQIFYPLWDWPKGEVLRIIQAHGVHLPGDYLLASRSFAGVPGVRHLERMAQVYPEDFGRVEVLFPLIRAQMARMEFWRRGWTTPDPTPDPTPDTAPGPDPGSL